jgi:hypothetical protein
MRSPSSTAHKIAATPELAGTPHERFAIPGRHAAYVPGFALALLLGGGWVLHVLQQRVDVLPRGAMPTSPMETTVVSQPLAQRDDTMQRLAALLGQREPFQDPATVLLLETLPANSANCAAVGAKLMARYPQHAADIGTILIGALVRAKDFPAALRLAACGPAEERTGWLEMIYPSWIAQAENRSAVAEEVRTAAPEAFSATLRGWTSVAPSEVARYSQQLPFGEQRHAALSAALNEWVLRDPVAVLGWIHTLPDDTEFDYALSHIVLRCDALVLPARQAVEFAASIQDVQLRAIVLRHAVGVWLQENPQDIARGSARPAAGTGDRPTPLQSLIF